MCQIIRKMQQDLHPPTMPSKPSHRSVNYFLPRAVSKLKQFYYDFLIYFLI